MCYVRGRHVMLVFHWNLRLITPLRTNLGQWRYVCTFPQRALRQCRRNRTHADKLEIKAYGRKMTTPEANRVSTLGYHAIFPTHNPNIDSMVRGRPFIRVN